MPRRKNPDRMTAEEEIRSVLDWAQRTGHLNIADALRRALAKWPVGGSGRRSKAEALKVALVYRKVGVGQEEVTWPVGDGVQRALAKWPEAAARKRPHS